MREEKAYYYQVSLVLPAIWKQNVFTYSSGDKLHMGNIVLCPFGKEEKIGLVTAEVKKPNHDTKSIHEVLDIILPKKSLDLMDWLNAYYPGFGGVNTQLFIPSFLKKMPLKSRQKISEVQLIKKLPDFTKDQAKAHKLITENKQKNIVLHGITGSGKTRIYEEIIKDNIANNKNTLVLYPEISLTSQLLETLSKSFGNEKVLVYHSKQTESEQRNTWLKIISSKSPLIVIGPRSAIFLPFNNLGTVILDESHDNSYKQDSGSRYNGILAAAALSNIYSAQLILGSATPPVQETEQILSKNGLLVCMHSLAKTEDINQKIYSVVDMTKKNNRSKYYQLSKELISKIELSISNKKQSLIFLNKRGTARMIICENCSWYAECPKCDTPLTHHHDSFTLQCHICGYSRKSHTSCPECNASLILKNPGIKALEQELRILFPSAKIFRFDSDNKKKDTFQENYKDIKNGSADIIIGTQLITKGLDLPKLETVGIIEADSVLLLPDFTSEERAFQQLTQVSGRVGRGHSLGNVIIQTYQPDSFIFPDVMKQDWHKFYETEIRKRKLNYYPPYTFAMKVWATKNSREAAIKQISKIVSKNKHLRILGPAPSFYEKVGGKFSWQIIILSGSRKKLSEIAISLPKDVFFDLDPVSFL
jgi:primosomal protein N' (replication factor Y)